MSAVLKVRRLLAGGRVVAVPLVAAAAVALAAVPAGAAPHNARRSHAINKKELAQLKAYIKTQQASPAWHAPGPPVKGSVLKGKTLLVFPISSDIPSCEAQTQDFQKLGKQLGAKVISPASTTGPNGWISNLGQAITDHANAVAMLCGVVNAAVAPQLAALHAHGIPVVDGNYNEVPPVPFFSGLSAEVGIDTALGVKDDLAQALISLKGKPAHILYVTSSQVIQDLGVGKPSTDHQYGAYPALKQAIKQWCPGSCTINQIDNLQTTQWTSDGSGVGSYLNANPQINTVIVAFDGEVDNLITEVAAAAASHPGLKIYCWGAGAAELRDLQHSPVMAADAGPDDKWDTYDAMDQVIRLLNHKKPAPVSKEFAPNVFFTKSNVASFFAGPGDTYSDKSFGHGAYIKDFDTLWGVKSTK